MGGISEHVLWICYAAAIAGGLLALVTVFLDKKAMIRWALAAGMAVLTAESLFAALSMRSVITQQATFWLVLQLGASALAPVIWLIFSLTFARSNAKEFLRRWKYWLWLALALPLGVVGVWRGGLISQVIFNDLFDERLFRLGNVGVFFFAALLVFNVVVLVNLEQTFRAAVGTMRWRVKFLILGVSLLFLVRLYTCSQAMLYSEWRTQYDVYNGLALILSALLIGWSAARAGLMQVDVYPSRQVIVRSITLVLTGAYLLVVGFLAKYVRTLAGSEWFAAQAFIILLGLVALGVILLSDRLRLRLSHALSRHFRRPAYDHRLVWRAFTERTASLIDGPELCRATARVISDTLQVLSVTIWTTDEYGKNLTFGGSTLLTDVEAQQLLANATAPEEILQRLRECGEPLDLEAGTELWLQSLRSLTPGQFTGKGGHRFCVPLRAAGRLVGCLMLGDRVSGIKFSLEEFDLIKAMADQLAAQILNLELIRKLFIAREMEAFQTMSAFFVHDLKNTASALSLTLQNFHRHFDKPEFREDAFQAVSKSVRHLTDLVASLSLLRQELKLNPELASLSAVVEEALGESGPFEGVHLHKRLPDLPLCRLDRGQIKKVITNLLANAREAVQLGGNIRVETLAKDGWIAVAVEDDGCGMSAEFIRRSLFRPFQTTKKNGIGIGMFHSKAIVEAHKGRIEVVSKLNLGAAFRVWLPLEENTP